MQTRRSLTQSKFIWQYHWIFALQLIITAVFIGANYHSIAAGILSFFGLIALSVWTKSAPVVSIFYSLIWALVFYTFVASTTFTMPTVVAVTFVGLIVGIGFNITGLAFFGDMAGKPL